MVTGNALRPNRAASNWVLTTPGPTKAPLAPAATADWIPASTAFSELAPNVKSPPVEP